VEVTAGRQEEARRPQRVVCAVALLGYVVALAAPVASQTGTGNPNSSKPPTILFMCPHGAAKSVLASAYFQRRAKERGLNVHVESAGTEPDATVSPAVAAHLKAQGYSIPIAKPRKVAAAEFAAADVVISIGCDLAALPQPGGQLVRWDDVPALSDGFAAADEAIRTRVNDLVEELVRSMPKAKESKPTPVRVQEE
jgi:arsenate reductase